MGDFGGYIYKVADVGISAASAVGRFQTRGGFTTGTCCHHLLGQPSGEWISGQSVKLKPKASQDIPGTSHLGILLNHLKLGVQNGRIYNIYIYCIIYIYSYIYIINNQHQLCGWNKDGQSLPIAFGFGIWRQPGPDFCTGAPLHLAWLPESSANWGTWRSGTPQKTGSWFQYLYCGYSMLLWSPNHI